MSSLWTLLLWTRYGIQCFSQQRAVTWHVFGGAQRSGLGRLSALFESPLTGSSFTCTLLDRSTSWPRNLSDLLTLQITAAPDRFCWTRNVVSGQFKFMLIGNLQLLEDTKYLFRLCLDSVLTV